jgi:hypothetical protein
MVAVYSVTVLVTQRYYIEKVGDLLLDKLATNK